MKTIKAKVLEVIGTESKEALIEFLRERDLNPTLVNLDRNGFSRQIQFRACDRDYTIIWYQNESTLYFGRDTQRDARIPFRYVYDNDHYPHKGKFLGFTYRLKEVKSMFDSRFEWSDVKLKIKD